MVGWWRSVEVPEEVFSEVVVWRAVVGGEAVVEGLASMVLDIVDVRGERGGGGGGEERRVDVGSDGFELTD